MGLTCRQTDSAHVTVFDGSEPVAEIDNLRLVFARFSPGSPHCIGEEVPVPLYWMQYANHEDPERNAASHGVIIPRESAPDHLKLECRGSTASGSCRGIVTLTLQRIPGPLRYRYTVDAFLEVIDPQGWTVTPNPHHGEVEFTNVWPIGTFVKDPHARKRYHSCLLTSRNGVWRIPHHHGESTDKHNIPMTPGDRFLWLLEDENLCVTYLDGGEISTGLCAYMWDAHFAFKVCTGGSPVTLPKGTTFAATYSIECIDRAEAELVHSKAAARTPEGSDLIPVYVEGINRFTGVLGVGVQPLASGWPWEYEIHDGMQASLDLSTGFDDSSSLCLTAQTASRGLWKATAFGPAYGLPAFPDRVRFRLSAFAKCAALHGKANIGLRIHPEGKGNLFDVNDYDLYPSPQSITGETGWTRLEVVSRPITPPPDRLHILLSQDGSGTTWFDNVHLEVL